MANFYLVEGVTVTKTGKTVVRYYDDSIKRSKTVISPTSLMSRTKARKISSLLEYKYGKKYRVVKHNPQMGMVLKWK